EAGAAARPGAVERPAEGVAKGGPRSDLPGAGDDLRAVGIVEAEDRCPDDGVARTEARRVLGVALDLRRAALVALDQDTGAVAGERHAGPQGDRHTHPH